VTTVHRICVGRILRIVPESGAEILIELNPSQVLEIDFVSERRDDYVEADNRRVEECYPSKKNGFGWVSCAGRRGLKDQPTSLRRAVFHLGTGAYYWFSYR
jgi:hypothetical protein